MILIISMLFSQNQHAQQIFDLRPKIDTNTFQYIELSGLDSIATWKDLENSLCSQSSESDVVFVRVSLTADTFVAASSTSDHIIIALKAYCDDTVSLKKGLEIGMTRVPYTQRRIIKGKELIYFLFNYYDLGERRYFISYADLEVGSYADFKYRIDVAAIGNIYKSIEFLKIISKAYISVKDDFQSEVPPLVLFVRKYPNPPPPPLPEPLPEIFFIDQNERN